MPGAGFKKKARKWREPTIEMISVPFEMVKSALVRISLHFQCDVDAHGLNLIEADGTAGPSVMATCLKNLSGRSHAADEEELIRNVGGVSYSAGAGTVGVTLSGSRMSRL
jgi:hypothetical protein